MSCCLQEKCFPNKSNGALGEDEDGLSSLLLHVPVVFLSKKDISYRTIIIPYIIRHKKNGGTKAVRAMNFRSA